MVSTDGSLAAVIEASRAVVMRLGGGGFEVGLPANADVAWVGMKLLVVARSDLHTTAYLIDTAGDAPRTLSEIRLEPAMRLVACVGSYGLLFGRSAAVLGCAGETIAPYQFMARSLPNVVGTAGSQFVVAVPGTIEEWDPVSRMPKRRFKLARSGPITALGGTDRLLWMTTQQEPARIDVLPLINRSQPKAHDLPEPIAMVLAHPQCDVIACVGAESSKIYAIDLDGRTGMRTLTADGIDRIEAGALAVSRGIAAVVGQHGRPIAFVSVDGRELEAPRVPEISRPLSSEIELPESLTADDPLVVPPPAVEPEVKWSTAADDPSRAGAGALKEGWATGSSELMAKLAAMRSPASAESKPVAAPTSASALTSVPAPSTTSGATTSGPMPSVAAKPSRTRREPVGVVPLPVTWRDQLTDWVRGVIDGSFDRPPQCESIDALAARFELPSELVPALALLYGCHLLGLPGAAPADVATLLGRRWDEALGRGRFAAAGLATSASSRVALATAVQRALDELPPSTGTLVGEPGVPALLGPCVVVGAGPLAAIAPRYLAQVGGAILAAHDSVDVAELELEARAFGASPMRRLAAAPAPKTPTVLVVTEELAKSLGLPRL